MKLIGIGSRRLKYMFDVNAIREQLNELAFEDGRRVLSLGVVSELLPDAAPAEVEIEREGFEPSAIGDDIRDGVSGDTFEPDVIQAVDPGRDARNSDVALYADGYVTIVPIDGDYTARTSSVPTLRMRLRRLTP